MSAAVAIGTTNLATSLPRAMVAPGESPFRRRLRLGASSSPELVAVSSRASLTAIRLLKHSTSSMLTHVRGR